jgi:acetyl-CoA synthetase
MHKGVAETAVIGAADELTGQAVYAFVTLKPEFQYDASNESALLKELTLQIRKTIGPFAAPKKIYIVGALPKTRSGKVSIPAAAQYNNVLNHFRSDHASHHAQDRVGRG